MTSTTRTLQAANVPDRWVSPDGMIDLRLGRWQDVLADVESCDAVITDPPYSARTHEGHDATTRGHAGAGKDSAQRRAITYEAIDADGVREIVASWSPRALGWVVAMTSHDLWSAYESSLLEAGRYVFQPIPAVIPGMTCRLSGDGPSSWAVWMCVARPKTAAAAKWGTLPGAYITPAESLAVVGGKPLALMRAIVRDYTRPGDLVVDPFCGGATTAIACRMEGRRCITSEQDPETFEKALARCQRGVTPDLFAEVAS